MQDPLAALIGLYSPLKATVFSTKALVLIQGTISIQIIIK